MRYFIFFLLLSTFILNGCGGSNEETDLHAFAANQAQQRGFAPIPNINDIRLADLNLSTPQDYVEIRNIFTSHAPSDYTIVHELDAASKASLSDAQLFALNTETSLSGYQSGCLPDDCVDYLVGIKGQQTTLVDNRLDLVSFLGDIDSPAEIKFISRNSLYFKENGSGYLTLTVWSDCNGSSGVDLVQVSRFGDITVQQNLVRNSSDMVC